MVCKKCLEELTADNVYPSDHRYCITCGTEHTAYLSERRHTLASLREMNLESKIIQTKYLIKCAVMEFGLDKVYISYSGGKDSTVLSHIAKSMYPNILHLFANTTNEYPETLDHIRWEKDENGTNIIIKERTEGGLNKGATFVPPYSAHFWFFRIEQSRVRYGDSILPIPICQSGM